MENDIGYCKNRVTNSFLFSDRLVDIVIFVVQASMTFSSVFGTYVERFNLGYRPAEPDAGHFLWFQRIVLLNITLFVLLLPASHDGINESGIE